MLFVNVRELEILSICTTVMGLRQYDSAKPFYPMVQAYSKNESSKRGCTVPVAEQNVKRISKNCRTVTLPWKMDLNAKNALLDFQYDVPRRFQSQPPVLHYAIVFIQLYIGRTAFLHHCAIR